MPSQREGRAPDPSESAVQGNDHDWAWRDADIERAEEKHDTDAELAEEDPATSTERAQGQADGGGEASGGEASGGDASDGSAAATHGDHSVKHAAPARRPQERGPGHEPDVFLDVPKVRVGEIYFDVERLDAHLALRAKLAKLVQLVAGVHVHLGKVELDIKDVVAEALLKVRLENVYDILDRTMLTLDRNPDVLQGLVKTLGTTVNQVGGTAQQAIKPGGAVGKVVDNVGQVGKEALGPGGAVTEAADQVGGAAQQAVKPGGAITETAQGVGDTAQQAVQPGGAVSEVADAAGHAAQGVTGAAGGAAQGVGDAAGGAAQGVSDAAGGAAQGAGNGTQGTGRDAGEATQGSGDDADEPED